MEKRITGYKGEKKLIVSKVYTRDSFLSCGKMIAYETTEINLFISWYWSHDLLQDGKS